jgi:RNA polymerase sigma-B factor
LSAHEKTLITLAAGNGDKRACELLVLMYEFWARKLATDYARTHRILGVLVVEELLQECRLALLTAAQRWDPKRGAFTTYARWWLLSAMEREDNSGTSGISVPANAHRKPGTRELALNAHQVLSLDVPIGEVGDTTFMDQLERPSDEPEFEAEDLDALPGLVARLPEPQRFAIERYYFGQKTLEEVGLERGVTKARVGQLVQAGVASLKRMMAKRDKW